MVGGISSVSSVSVIALARLGQAAVGKTGTIKFEAPADSSLITTLKGLGFVIEGDKLSLDGFPQAKSHYLRDVLFQKGGSKLSYPTDDSENARNNSHKAFRSALIDQLISGKCTPADKGEYMGKIVNSLGQFKDVNPNDDAMWRSLVTQWSRITTATGPQSIKLVASDQAKEALGRDGSLEFPSIPPAPRDTGGKADVALPALPSDIRKNEVGWSLDINITEMHLSADSSVDKCINLLVSVIKDGSYKSYQREKAMMLLIGYLFKTANPENEKLAIELCKRWQNIDNQ